MTQTRMYERHGDDLFVDQDFDGCWHSFYRQATGARGRYRIKSDDLPDRQTQDEAQADLDRYAKKNGFPEAD